MKPLINTYDRLIASVERILGDWFVPSLARFGFSAVLLVYYWQSALTKLGKDASFSRLFTLDPSGNAHVQMFPKAMEAVGYDPSALSFHYKLIAVMGTWAEFLLPLLILIGLLTRAAALGMIGFISVQSLVDVFGHGLTGSDIGGWFDAVSGSLIMDQRLLWVSLLLILVARGAGPISLDRALRGKSRRA